MSKQDCKVFIGGLSWDTNDTRLRNYFENFGMVKEAFVSYDRDTGKPRGFGFVVFEDIAVADRVVLNKHTIDRREVDAKHAMPRHDYTVPRQMLPGAQDPQAPRMRKIFVGGLPSSVVDRSLRHHFEQFGPVEDAVVMIDHQSKRPRGFGFVTFRDDAALENALAFESKQALHGKDVEVKRAVPRDLLHQYEQLSRAQTRFSQRDMDIRALSSYPYGYFAQSGAAHTPYGHGADAAGHMVDVHGQMDRHLSTRPPAPNPPYYTSRMDPAMQAQMLFPQQHPRTLDFPTVAPHWPPSQNIMTARSMDHNGHVPSELDPGWPGIHICDDADPHHHHHHHHQQHAMPGIRAPYTMHGMSMKTEPVQMPNHCQATPLRQFGSGGADAFENLASSLGASLPIGASSFLT